MKELKTKKLTPRNSAPVKRQNVATVSTDPTPIVPLWVMDPPRSFTPFAGDDAE